MTGSIPKELEALHDLEYLDLSWNQLSGEIPAELGQLIKLGEKLWYFEFPRSKM